MAAAMEAVVTVEEVRVGATAEVARGEAGTVAAGTVAAGTVAAAMAEGATVGEVEGSCCWGLFAAASEPC